MTTPSAAAYRAKIALLKALLRAVVRREIDMGWEGNENDEADRSGFVGAFGRD
jgi:hypothetical protein